MDLFPRSLGSNRRRAIESDERKRQNDWDAADDKLMDRLDLVVLIMGIGEGKHRKPRTMGDLIDLLADEKSGEAASPAPRK